jgi:hypothetical protein
MPETNIVACVVCHGHERRGAWRVSSIGRSGVHKKTAPAMGRRIPWGRVIADAPHCGQSVAKLNRRAGFVFEFPQIAFALGMAAAAYNGENANRGRHADRQLYRRRL